MTPAAPIAALAAASLAWLAWPRGVWTLWVGPVPTHQNLTIHQAWALGAGHPGIWAVDPRYAPPYAPPPQAGPCPCARRLRGLRRRYVAPCAETAPHTVHTATHFGLPGEPATAPLAGPLRWRWALGPAAASWPECTWCLHPVVGRLYDTGHGPQHRGCHRV